MENTGLKKALKPIHLWGITVGMVISGQYFGWNYGFEAGGVMALAIAVGIITIFYTTFIFSYAELSTSIPRADGPSEYARRALGPFMGYLTGLAVLFEFVFAPPAIAVSTGAYVHFLLPSVSPIYGTVAVFLFFILINLIGVKGAALIEMVATILALVGLFLYYGAGLPHVKIDQLFANDPFAGGWTSILAAIPFALWFYLAVEGGAMAAEEVENPKKDIPKGFISGILTLAICTVGTLFVTAGLGGGKGDPADYPLPQALSAVYGQNSILPTMVAVIGLAGLIASLHGIIIGYSRQTFALSRAGYLPRFLSRLNKQKVPHWGLIVPGLIGVICAASANFASGLIILSVFGAVLMYCLSMISLFVLRRKEPNLERPYKVFYPLVPGVALALGLLSLYSVIRYSVLTTKLPILGVEIPLQWIILSIFAVGVIYYWVQTRAQLRKSEDPSLKTELGN
ncbi:ethanolamine:proton symporter, EAT family [Marininema mesophilum]|uniref:Ethanolamine:proton symporter, EAT family n=1 Tax=Marininema mesophilum TaxID=1048340 RepID=A0A1H2WD03_9BACL|nr:ethanolamine permease [Marininema mesophilum]SDW78398.1 ethanolamine:proton symporter, EAT family [Marininema mesophilum]